MRIIRHRVLVQEVTYSRFFTWADDPGAGFSFPCDATGERIDPSPVQDANYVKCLARCVAGLMYDDGVVTLRHDHYSHAVGLCGHCDQEVVLYRFTNQCGGCGALYNSAGQALPDVIELRGTLYGKTGWNSDVGQAYYKDDALIAALVTRTLKKEV